MCGIVAYLGRKQAVPILLNGLKRLEYRGYDSCGITVINKKATTLKTKGRIKKLEKLIRKKSLKGDWGIGHTRWATHGEPNDINAHPHFDCHKEIFLVHNGIVENYQQIKEQLRKEGHRFVSETDTEVLIHLIEKFFKGDLEEAVIEALKLVKGTYGLAVIAKKDPQKIVIARNSSPLLVGIGKNEYLVASDPAAVLGYTRKVVYLNDREVAVINRDGVHFSDLNHQVLNKKAETIEWDLEDVKKNGYGHYMLKEIFEQPESLRNSMLGRIVEKEGLAKLGGLEIVEERLRKVKRIIITACGTAYYAGLIGEYMFEEYAGIPTEVEFASEFRYRKPIFDRNTALLCISQSGETADTLAALKEAKRKGVLTLGIVNVVGSTIARETDAGVYNHIGPEIGVASTKAFTSQLCVLALMTVFLGRQREMSLVTGRRIGQELQKLPELIERILRQAKRIKKLAKKYYQAKDFLFLGRKYNYPIALEGALKLKEISYIHAEGYSAGEMKHGPIALIEKDFPTLGIVPSDSVYEKTISNLEEIKARQGPIIAIATEGNKEIQRITKEIIYIPKTLEMLSQILTTIPLQLFAYYCAVFNKKDVDKPRNLAKSVTVE